MPVTFLLVSFTLQIVLEINIPHAVNKIIVSKHLNLKKITGSQHFRYNHIHTQ